MGLFGLSFNDSIAGTSSYSSLHGKEEEDEASSSSSSNPEPEDLQIITRPPQPHHRQRRKLLLLRRLLVGLGLVVILVSWVLQINPHSLQSDKKFRVQKFAASRNPRVLNVHVVPHSHDDVGWQKTVEQYYLGGNQSIQETGAVRDILTTSMQALLQNPERTFCFAEMKFFSMWWDEQPPTVRRTVKQLLQNKQLCIVNGGWDMHDEATTHFIGMIDQMTLGHNFLKQQLDIVPTVGWQLDPFGHSATQASLLTFRMGLDALYFGRIDSQDLQRRHLARQCEGLWNASQSEKDSTIFWGLAGSYGGNYNFLNNRQHLEDLTNETLGPLLLQELLEKIARQADQTRGNHILLTMGGDFAYSNATRDFYNLDRFMEMLAGSPNVSDALGPRFDRLQMFYSTPEYYTQSKFSERQQRQKQQEQPETNADPEYDVSLWEVKQDDFFPYGNCELCYWTGYFSSRVSFKRMERVAASFLLGARQIESLLGTTLATKRFGQDRPLFELEDALAISQHHDAITGTARQHVADDYSRRLHKGMDTAARHVIELLQRTMVQKDPGSMTWPVNWQYCPLVNESKCEMTETAAMDNGEDLYVVVYNSLAQERSTIVRLVVSGEATFEIKRVGDEETAPIQIVRSIPALPLRVTDREAKYILLFDTGTLPSVGAVVFRVSKIAQKEVIESSSPIEDGDGDDWMEVSNGIVSARLDQQTGMLRTLSQGHVHVQVNHSWGYYPSFDATIDTPDLPNRSFRPSSGAYIFRPKISNGRPEPIHAKSAKIYHTSDSTKSRVIEVHIEFEVPWFKQVTRILPNQPYIELEYTIGPIPIEHSIGKELVAIYASDISNHKVFYTDSNGREFQKRKRDHRPSWRVDTTSQPIASNFYPITTAMYIEDESEKSGLTVLVDRAQGGSSLRNGEMQVMVQRRLLADDHRGVQEPLNETTGGITPYPPYGNGERVGDGIVVRGIHRLQIGGAKAARSSMDPTYAEPIVFVGSFSTTTPHQQGVTFSNSSFSLVKPLPENIMLVTLTRLEANVYFVRLAHQYAIGADDELSKPVVLDLTDLFQNLLVLSIEETTLSGNQKWEDFLARRLRWTRADTTTSLEGCVSSTSITMGPMQVRAFKLVVTTSIK